MSSYRDCVVTEVDKEVLAGSAADLQSFIESLSTIELKRKSAGIPVSEHIVSKRTSDSLDQTHELRTCGKRQSVEVATRAIGKKDCFGVC